MRLRAAEERQRAPNALWLHSYVAREADGRSGLACGFLADSASTLLHHAERNLLPAAEVLAVAQTLGSRPFAPTQAVLVRRLDAAAFERVNSVQGLAVQRQ